MARVNHKRVKQLINEKRSQITDRQFFTSRMLALHFEDMAVAQTRRYKYTRRIHVDLCWRPSYGISARTDNMVIEINAGHPRVTKVRSRNDRYDVVCGLFAHELGHCLFTDFLAEQTHRNYLSAYKWYPEPPVLKSSSDLANDKAFWEFAHESSENLGLILQLAKHFSNILEDGYVESRMLARFPGRLGACLEVLRKRQWADVETLTQLKEQEEDGGHIAKTMMRLMLYYVKFGEIKYGIEPLSDERLQTLFGLLPELDRAITECSGKVRCGVVNQILIRCWPWWSDYLEQLKKCAEEGEDGSTTASELLSAILRTIAGSAEAEGVSAPVPDMSNTTAASNPEKRMVTWAQANEGKSEDEESEKPEAAPEAEASPGTGAPKDSETEESRPEEPQGTQGSTVEDEEIRAAMGASITSMQKRQVSDAEGGRHPYKNTSFVSQPKGGTVERNDDYHREAYSGAASDIERMLDRMAEKAACKELENERIRELNDIAQGISYGDIHQGVNIRVNRVAEVDEELIQQYDSVCAPLRAISRQLQKSILQQLKERQRGAKQTGLMMGHRLDSHALHRNDGKVFYKNSLPGEAPELAVALLLDESGSMYSCDRCTYARASAIILYDFCRALNIPVMVYGHSTGFSCSNGESVELYSYAEFEAVDNDDKYRLMDISARGSNRDGAALRFVAEQLSHRPEETRMLILVSDGQPAADKYYGSAAEEDLRGIKQEYRRKGILFIAAAIGDDKQNIERIYGDSFLDITDLHQLPVKLTAIVKRFVRA